MVFMDRLYRIRWQESWGERLGDYLADAYLETQISGLVEGLAAEWFPNGATVEQDRDSPYVWVVVDRVDGRQLYLFAELLG